MACNIQIATRIAAVICGGLIIAMSITRFASLNYSHFQNFILTLHYIWMGAVLVLAEFNIAYVIQKFRLISSFCGRGAYCIFLGTIMITNDNTFQLAVAILLFVAGGGYIFIQLFSKKYGWVASEEPENKYKVPAAQSQPYQPPYQTNVNFQYGAPALQ